MGSFLLTAFLLSIKFATSTPLQTRAYNPNENLVLADCGIGDVPGHPTWSTSFKALYFKGNVWPDDDFERTNSLPPNMVADVAPGSFLGDYPWRDNLLQVTFPNNDVFQIYISGHRPDEDKVMDGIATHKYDDHELYCFPYHKNNVYQIENGSWCMSAFVCNHRNTTGPWPIVNVGIGVSTEGIDLQGDYNVLDDIYGLLPLSNGATECSPGDIPIPGSKCSINFHCFGSINGLQTIPILRDALNNLTTQTNYVNQTSVEQQWCEPCLPSMGSCPHVPICHTVYTNHTRMPKSVSMDIMGEDGGNYGHLDYDITCPESNESTFCRVCSDLNAAPSFSNWWKAVLSATYVAFKVACNTECGL